MPVTALATSLNARLRGRFNPNWRYVHGGIGLGKAKRGYYEITPGNTKQRFQLITNIPNAERQHLELELVLNNDTIYKLNGDDIHKFMRDYHGRKAKAGVFDIFFSDPNVLGKENLRLGELVTFPTDRLFLYVDIKSNVTNEPALELREYVTAPQQKRAFIPRVFRTSHTVSSSSENYMKLERTGIGKFVRRMHLISANITRVDQYQGDQLIHELKKAEHDFDLGEAKPKAKVGQASTFHYDRTLHGYPLDGLIEALPNTRFKLGMSAATSFDYIVEMYEQVADLPALEM